MRALNDEELEKVSGGEAADRTTYNVVAKYRDTEDGLTLYKDLGRFPIADAEANGESMAKEWCTQNNKIYAGYNLADLVTSNYDSKILLNTITKGTN